MRKNKAMRLAAILMVVCLVATCAICGTLAKYVTSARGQDTTSIAKWGIEMDRINLSSLFDHPGTPQEIVIENRIAPGTSGSAQIVISGSGTPEVAYHFQPSVSLTEIGYGYEIPDALLDHVTWSLKNNDTTVAEGDWEQFSNAIHGLQGDYQSGTAFPIQPGTYVLSWNWPFEGSGTEEEKTTWDRIDTLAASYGEERPIYAFALTLTVNQIDELPTP